ncbi:MAG: formate dehydrogenase accessory sulfurtransferase FdhD [Woeseiaceae bacterium]
MSGSSRIVTINKVDGTQSDPSDDVVAVEEPLEIQLVSAGPGGAAAKSISITMRTPGHDAELALGFLFTEAIISSKDQVQSVRHVGEPDPATGLANIVRIEIDATVALDLDRLQRHFYTTSSCGVCGKASLEALKVTGQTSLADHKISFPAHDLAALPERIRERQPLFSTTGGLHAAAVFGPDGEIIIVREDIGRHNATDKVIGSLFRENGLPAHEQGLFVSGRASFELVQKALVAGIPLLAAVGAPSSLAVEMAVEFGMTLVGFLRDGKFNVYTGPERIAL